MPEPLSEMVACFACIGWRDPVLQRLTGVMPVQLDRRCAVEPAG